MFDINMEVQVKTNKKSQHLTRRQENTPAVMLVGLGMEDQALFTRILKAAGYTVCSVADLRNFKAQICDQFPNLVLCEQILDDGDGFQLSEWIRSNPELQTIPVVLVASLMDAADQQKAMEAGVDDFIIKPLREYEILLRIQSLIRIHHLNEMLTRKVHELEMAKADLEQLVITDALTGLYNYRFFKIFLARETLRAKRYKLPVSVLMLDIDHFKKCNDTYGHTEANKMLQSLGRLLLDNLRSVDLVSRYGGEEFGIILPDTRKADALIVAEKIRQIVSQTMLVAQCEPITVSIGVSAFPHDGRDEESLVHCSDQALLQAKRNGRNTICAA